MPERCDLENLKYGVSVDTLAYQIGLRNGDNVLSVDNKQVESINNYLQVPLVMTL